MKPNIDAAPSRATIVALLGAASMLGFMEPLILLMSKPEYVAAVPILALLLPSAWLRFAATCSYPLALASNNLGRRNAVVALRLVLLAGAVAYGLTAVVLAAVQLAGTVLVRVAFDLPLVVRLRRMAKDETTADAT